MASKKCTSDFSGRLQLIYGDIENISLSSVCEPLTDLLSSWDSKKQLEKIKTITSQLKHVSFKDSELSDSRTDILEVFVNIYLGNEAKHPVRRVIASCLQSLPISFHDDIVNELCHKVRLHIFSVKTTTLPINQLRHNVNIINGLLENFALGEKCVQRMSVEVLSYLTECLETFINNYSPTLPPVEHNEAMHHCHVTLQTTNKTLQKCWDLFDRLQSTDPSINEKLTRLAQRIVTCANAILKLENFLRDGCCTAGVSFGLLLSLLHKEEVVNLILRCVFPRFQAEICNEVPDWLVKCGSCDLDLSLTSHLCVCHGLLGVLDGKDLLCEFTNKCLLVDVFFEDLFEASKGCLDTVAKLLLAKALVGWSSRACSVVESFCKGDKSMDVFLGSGMVSQKLLTYVWTTWEDPIDALRLKSKQIFENTVKLHILAAKSDPTEDPFLLSLINSLMNISWSVKGKYSPLSCLLDHVGANQMIRLHPGLSDDIIGAFKEQDLSCYASELFEKLCRVHLQEIKSDTNSKGLWEKCWVDPVLRVLCSNHKTQKVHVLEYVLPRLLKVNKSVLSYMISSLSGKTENEGAKVGTHRLGALVMCLRRARAMGLLPQPVSMDTRDPSLMFGLIEFDVIKHALSSNDEQVRMDTFALLCENNKTSEFIQKAEFDLVKFFLHHNFNNQSPSFRQSIISFIKKLFVRMDESAAAILRIKSKSEQPRGIEHYTEFREWLLKELFNNLFCGASFARTTLTLSILHLFVTALKETRKSVPKNKDEDKLSCLRPNHVRSLVECFTDSYEENKMQALKILNMLPESTFPSEMNEWLTELFESGLKLSVSTKPHDCNTAAYLFRLVITRKMSTAIILSHLQNRRGIISAIPEYTVKETDDATISTCTEESHDAKERNTYLLTSVLLNSLQDQLSVAKCNLLHAAATKPLYPTMHCIRYLLSDISLIMVRNVKHWRTLLTAVIQCCFDVAEVVSPVVHNSSPEGNIPVEAIKGDGLIQMECTNLEKDEDTTTTTVKRSEKTVTLMPEYLIVCCWRSIKEVSLLLGDLAVKTPIIDAENEGVIESVSGLITFQQILTIGQYFITQLLESKHRGAFELAYAGFVQMMEMLWRSPMKALRELPVTWLGQVMLDIQSEEGMSKLCATRRSAGVPFYVQAVLVTEPNIQGKQLFNQTMAQLLDISLETDHKQPANSDAQVHGLNILRALYRDTRIGKDVALYVADGVKAALLGFISPDWAIRNSSTLLFSALMTRIFGVKRSKDDSAISKKNCLTGRIFFHRYPSLYPFLLEQLENCTQHIGLSGRFQLHPGLYPILLLLGRLMPSVMEGGDTSLSLVAFIPFVVRCASSPVLKTRLMAARALQPLVFKDQLTSVLTDLLAKLPTMPDYDMTQSHIHGILIQIKELLSSLDQLASSLLETVAMAIQSRLLKSVWLLTRSNGCLVTRQAMLETVQYAVSTLPTLECDLSSVFTKVVENEIGTLNALSHHTPGMIDFSVSLATAYLKICTTGLETCDKVVKLLHSDLYEVRLVALEFLVGALKDLNGEDSVTGDVTALSNFTSTASGALWEKLSAMILQQETWTECLQKTLHALALLVEINGVGVPQEIPLEMFQRAMLLAKTSSNVELKASAINLSGKLFKHLYRRFSTEPLDSSNKDVLQSWVTLVKDCSQVEQSDDVKLAVANIIVTNSKQLLLDPHQVSGPMTLTFWEVAFDLLQEDDLEIKDVMTSALPAIDQSISDPVHAMLTIDLLLGYFIKSQLPTYPELGLRFLFGLMIKEDNSVFEGEERLFDKGEMNPYKEEVILTRLVYQHINKILIGLLESSGCGFSSEEGCQGQHGIESPATDSKLDVGQKYQIEAGNLGDRHITNSNLGNHEFDLSSETREQSTEGRLHFKICSKHMTTILEDITDTVCARIETLLENDKDFSLSEVYLNTFLYEESVSIISRLISSLSCIKTSKLCSKEEQICTVLTKTKTLFNINDCNHFIFNQLHLD